MSTEEPTTQPTPPIDPEKPHNRQALLAMIEELILVAQRIRFTGSAFHTTGLQASGKYEPSHMKTCPVCQATRTRHMHAQQLRNAARQRVQTAEFGHIEWLLFKALEELTVTLTTFAHFYDGRRTDYAVTLAGVWGLINKTQTILRENGYEMMLPGLLLSDIDEATKEELEQLGWEHVDEPVKKLTLSDGTSLFPGMDREGNGAGALWGIQGEDVIILA